MTTLNIYSKEQVDALIAGAGGLPDPTSASAGDVLTLDSNKDPAWAAPGGGGMSAHTYTSWADFYNDLSSHKENCVVVYDYSSTLTLRSVSLEFDTNECSIGFTRPRESSNIQYFRITVTHSNTVTATYINATGGSSNWQSGTITVAIGSFTLWY